MPHDDLWSAIEHKLAGTEFFFREMSQDIVPPHLNHPQLAAIVATGVIVGHPWQEKFYHHLDAFLAMGRSIPEIIRCCFGIDRDRRLRAWISGLNPSEATRRQTFQTQFDPLSRSFTALPLSGARNITLHRTGVPPVEVHVIGRWGAYTGGPLAVIPQSELHHVIAGNDPALLWAATEAPQPVQPRSADFYLLIPSGSSASRVELFPECRRFLDAARKLVTDAQQIARAIHGSQSLKPPPG
jgi:hypothetical protein